MFDLDNCTSDEEYKARLSAIVMLLVSSAGGVLRISDLELKALSETPKEKVFLSTFNDPKHHERVFITHTEHDDIISKQPPLRPDQALSLVNLLVGPGDFEVTLTRQSLADLLVAAYPFFAKIRS